MNLFAEIKTVVLEAVARLAADGVLPGEPATGGITVEPPRDASHGDMATNAAMVLAKPAGVNPRDLAERLAALLKADSRIAEVTVAGPGFINLRLAPAMWRGVIGVALAEGASFGRSKMGAGLKVNVEYVSANPTGPLHVGHTRGAVFGDALASVLDFAGYDVTREYYINDGGAQVDALARSAFERYREAHGLSPEIAEGLYPGDYLIPVGAAMKQKFGDSLLNQPEEAWLGTIRDFAADMMMDLIRADLASVGVVMDVFYSEKSLYGSGQIEATLADLDSRGLIYEGVLEPPKGKVPEDWEPRPQTLFRATEYGDDIDRPIRKSDGAWTYFAPDIAYHKNKIDRGFDLLIDVWGADHGGYVKRMTAAVAALSDNRVRLDTKLCQLVRLYKGGEPFKMSKRAGTFVTLSDVVDEVGADVTRFVMLTRKNDAPLDFDFVKVLDQSRDNPVWYVQYAHARIHSLMTRAGEAGLATDDSTFASAELSGLVDDAERGIIRKIAEFPRLVESAATHHEPHRIAFYLYDLAAEFHSWWNRGHEDPALRMIRDDDPGLSSARLALARTVQVVISAGLGILGVTPMNEMK
ncbi:MAG TPA: arginine--tRNA ligase [Thermohalobaculum sp.]|nr:arginine--tRNA ligase [Thermohalobaculum sp.]